MTKQKILVEPKIKTVQKEKLRRQGTNHKEEIIKA
jgi:hypothetical protein